MLTHEDRDPIGLRTVSSEEFGHIRVHFQTLKVINGQ